MSDETLTPEKLAVKSDKHLTEIVRAQEFFAATPVVDTHMLANEFAIAEKAADKFTAKSGLMQFVFNDAEIADDPDVIKKVNEAKYYLKGYMSLVTAKLFGDNKNNLDAAFNIPPQKIKEIAVHLPLLSSFVSKKMSNFEHKSAVEFSTALIKTVLDLSMENYPGAIVEATNWLKSTGETIAAHAQLKQSTYNVTVFSGLISVTKVGGVIDIEPAFQIAGASLSVSEVKTSVANCVKSEAFTLNFEAPYFRAALNFDALQNPTIKEKLDKFITQGSVDQIDNSANYFGIDLS